MGKIKYDPLWCPPFSIYGIFYFVQYFCRSANMNRLRDMNISHSEPVHSAVISEAFTSACICDLNVIFEQDLLQDFFLFFGQPLTLK